MEEGGRGGILLNVVRVLGRLGPKLPSGLLGSKYQVMCVCTAVASTALAVLWPSILIEAPFFDAELNPQARPDIYGRGSRRPFDCMATRNNFRICHPESLPLADCWVWPVPPGLNTADENAGSRLVVGE